MSPNYFQYKSKFVKERLEKKGFINTHTKKKFFLIFFYHGQKTRSHTVINLRPNQIIGKGLFSKISSDLFLDNKQFIDLVECPVTKQDYINILIKQKII